MATWGHQAAAFSQAEMLHLERDALASSGISPGGRCRTTALIVAYGVLGTPRARVTRETIRAWFELLRDLGPDEVNDVRDAWIRAKSHMLKHDFNVKGVRGIMSNVIYLLQKADWDPVAYNCWRDPQKALWIIRDYKTSPDIVAHAIARAYLDKDAKRASSHYNGKGIESGIDTEHTLRHVRNIKDRSDTSYQYKAALESIMAALSWPASRIHEINPDFSNLCPRCNSAVENDFHVYWDCPCNLEASHENISSTNNLIERARNEHGDLPCLWLRGILPSGLAVVPDEYSVPSSDVVIEYEHNQSSSEWTSGVYYGDASGGENTSYKELRRVGVGICKVDESGELILGAYSNLPGQVQTVARGELFALLLLVRHLDPGVDIEYVTDNKGVFQIYSAGPIAAKNSSNCDMYQDLFKMQYEKAIQIRVRWMPSHQSNLDEIPVGVLVSELDLQANRIADKLAGKAAAKFQLPTPVVHNYLEYPLLVAKIQKRLATIFLNLPKRSTHKGDKKPVTPRQSLDYLLANTSHTLSVTGPRVQCTKCLNSFHKSSTSCRNWLTTNCVPLRHSPVTAPKPVKVRETIHLGNKSSHVSHDLYSYRGLVYCNKCGAHGIKKFNYLSLPCAAPTDAGQVTLNKINKGLMPTGVTSWPDA